MEKTERSVAILDARGEVVLERANAPPGEMPRLTEAANLIVKAVNSYAVMVSSIAASRAFLSETEKNARQLLAGLLSVEVPKSLRPKRLRYQPRDKERDERTARLAMGNKLNL
jgi:hypothetical protein